MTYRPLAITLASAVLFLGGAEEPRQSLPGPDAEAGQSKIILKVYPVAEFLGSGDAASSPARTAGVPSGKSATPTRATSTSLPQDEAEGHARSLIQTIQTMVEPASWANGASVA